MRGRGRLQGRGAVGLSAALSSLANLGVSVIAVRVLDLNDFGLFVICLNVALFAGAVLRAAIGETALGASVEGQPVSIGLVLAAPAVAVALGTLLLWLQLSFASASMGLLLPGSLLAAAFSAAEVGKVRAISLCLLYTSPSPRDRTRSRMPSSA